MGIKERVEERKKRNQRIRSNLRNKEQRPTYVIEEEVKLVKSEKQETQMDEFQGKAQMEIVENEEDLTLRGILNKKGITNKQVDELILDKRKWKKLKKEYLKL